MLTLSPRPEPSRPLPSLVGECPSLPCFDSSPPLPSPEVSARRSFIFVSCSDVFLPLPSPVGEYPLHRPFPSMSWLVIFSTVRILLPKRMGTCRSVAFFPCHGKSLPLRSLRGECPLFDFFLPSSSLCPPLRYVMIGLFTSRPHASPRTPNPSVEGV